MHYVDYLCDVLMPSEPLSADSASTSSLLLAFASESVRLSPLALHQDAGGGGSAIAIAGVRFREDDHDAGGVVVGQIALTIGADWTPLQLIQRCLAAAEAVDRSSHGIVLVPGCGVAEVAFSAVLRTAVSLRSGGSSMSMMMTTVLNHEKPFARVVMSCASALEQHIRMMMTMMTSSADHTGVDLSINDMLEKLADSHLHIARSLLMNESAHYDRNRKTSSAAHSTMADVLLWSRSVCLSSRGLCRAQCSRCSCEEEHPWTHAASADAFWERKCCALFYCKSTMMMKMMIS